jgi:hypothetical protein
VRNAAPGVIVRVVQRAVHSVAGRPHAGEGKTPLALYASSKIDDDRDLAQEVLAVAVFPGAVGVFHMRMDPLADRFGGQDHRTYQAQSMRIPIQQVAAVVVPRP